MSMKRVLGMMLASRMGGRGRRRGSLGTAAMLGGLGGRRRMGGGKLGMAALGYMAYRAYQDSQARSGTGGHGAAGTQRGTGSPQGGIGDMIRDVADRLTGGAASGGAASGGAASGGAAPGGSTSGGAMGAGQPAAELQEEERAAAEFDEGRALLLIRAMITAAYSDGALSQTERANIMGEIESAGADPEDRHAMEREIANPRPLDELLTQVNDHEAAEEFYLASRAAIDGETPDNRAYLAKLRQRLGLSEEEAAEVDRLAS